MIANKTNRNCIGDINYILKGFIKWLVEKKDLISMIC